MSAPLQPTDAPAVSTLAQNCFKLASVVEALVRNGHVVDRVAVDEHNTVLVLKDHASNAKLHGVYRGIHNTGAGRFVIRSIKIHGVVVKWFTPVMTVIKGGKQ